MRDNQIENQIQTLRAEAMASLDRYERACALSFLPSHLLTDRIRRAPLAVIRRKVDRYMKGLFDLSTL